MNDYGIALFLHIVGALGIFVALGLEWTGLRQLASAVGAEQVHSWMGILGSVRKVGLVSMATAVISGLYMMLTAWGLVPWALVSLGAIVLLIALSAALTGPRMAAVGRALAAGKGTVSSTFQTLANHPLLWVSVQTRAAIALGIVFLKTAKPDLAGSLLTIGAAIILGLASAVHMPRRVQARNGSAG